MISVVKIHGPEWMTHQIKLLGAAKEAGAQRFAPSEFENGSLADDMLDILGLKPPVWEACKTGDLGCMRFSCDIFMNYLALENEHLDSEE